MKCEIVLIQNLATVNIIRKMNELSAGQKIVMPKAVLRTISLQKLRNPSPLTQKQQNMIKPSHTDKQHPQNKYEKMLDKKLGISKEDQENTSRVGNNEGRKMSKKFEEFKKEVINNQMKECTFKPTVHIPDKNVRTVNTFFQDQITFCQKKNDKIEEMRAILQANKVKENIFRPNAMLNRMHKPEDVEKVHERLYEDSKNKDKASQTSKQEPSVTAKSSSITKSQRFKGLSRGTSASKISHSELIKHSQMPSQQFHKISLHSHQDNVSVQLSSITSRKQSIELTQNSMRYPSKQCKSKEPCKRVDLNIYQKKDKDNSKNEELCIQKLMREMATVLQRCGLPLVFSYLQMNLFFQKMNFIPKQASDNARKALFQLWNMLQGEIFKEVSSLSVMKLVYSIMGCHNVSCVNKCIADTWLTNETKVEAYDRKLKQQGKQLTLRQNLLMITERDSKTIKITFDELYLNRLKLGQSELIKEEKANEFAFKPAISKTSVELAQKYRNRVLQESQKLISQNKLQFQVPEDGQIGHVNLLMLDEKRKDAVMQLKREERDRERRRQEDESMISMNQTERSSHRSTNNIHRQDRNQELYQMGKMIHQAKKDKSSDEVEEERWKNQLTFKPNLKSRTNILSALNAKQHYIPDYDKAVYRMHQARKQKQAQNSDRQEQNNTSPLFYLNVVMQGCQPTKIPVFSQDSMKSITEKVRVMMELDPHSGTQKLEKILKMQILPALKQMGIKLE